jgi:hypothetical protein
MNIKGQLQKKDRFGRFLKDRFFLRFHMLLILTATALSGLLATKVLLLLHVKSMLVRYPIAVVFSYLAFFGFVKLWLFYLASSGGGRGTVKRITDGAADIPDISDFFTGGSSRPPVPFGGGGNFGGGGASGIFEQGADIVHKAAPETLSSSPSGVGSGVADAAGDAVSGIFEDAGKVLLILGILLALVFGAGIYLIYQAPVILSEAAFQCILATSLARRMKKMDDPDWMGSVFRATAVPFLFVCVIAFVAAYVAHSAYPPASKMSEVLRYLLSK